MCGARNVADNLNNWHPLSGIVDQPVIDPYLQGDLTASGDVRQGQYIDKKDQNLGVADMQIGIGAMAKAIAGGATGSFLAGGGEAGAAGAGADFEAVGTSAPSQGGSSIGGGFGSDTLTGDPSGDTLDPNADANTNLNAGPADTSIVGPDGMQTLSPETAQLLGVNPADYTGGVSLSPGATSAPIETVPDSAPMDIPNSGGGGGGSGDGYFSQASDLLKKIGLSPASAGLLGLSAAQALSKPKPVQASKTQEGLATQNAQAASAVLQSGGTSSPAWTGQKSSIDATIDDQIKQQVSAMMQQAQNSGQGADSQVTQQQINKIKNQLESQRQAMYAQAQQQNVQAALQQLGISNQALSSVAGQQFSASNSAKQSAATTAQIALQLQALQNKGTGGGSASVVNQGNQNSA